MEAFRAAARCGQRKNRPVRNALVLSPESTGSRFSNGFGIFGVVAHPGRFSLRIKLESKKDDTKALQCAGQAGPEAVRAGPLKYLISLSVQFRIPSLSFLILAFGVTGMWTFKRFYELHGSMIGMIPRIQEHLIGVSAFLQFSAALGWGFVAFSMFWFVTLSC